MLPTKFDRRFGPARDLKRPRFARPSVSSSSDLTLAGFILITNPPQALVAEAEAEAEAEACGYTKGCAEAHQPRDERLASRAWPSSISLEGAVTKRAE